MPRSPRSKLSQRDAQGIADLIPDSQITALLRRAGIKQHQAAAAQHLKHELFPELIFTVVEDAIRLMDYAGKGKKKTVRVEHVREGVQLRYKKRVY